MNEKNTMYQDFINAQKEFEPARKQSVNPHFKSKYSDLSNCIDAVKEALNNNGFALVQMSHENENGVAVETVLYHKSGECIKSGILRLPASKQDPQGYGSAMTYARRYSLLAVCGIAPEDDDGNGAKSSDHKKSENTKIADKLEFENKRNNVFKWVVSEGVSSNELLNYLGLKSLDDFGKEELSAISSIYNKVKNEGKSLIEIIGGV